MAMGGGSGKMNTSKGRSYAMMLLMAFGAAILAILLLQKFRERRLFNLLIKEKDLELFSLHLLLQSERDHTKELKKKTSQMKEKVYSIRTEKINAEGQISEMQSRLATLQDEQRAMELSLEEKENEIKTMRAKETGDSIQENQQVVTLFEIVKQKEAEIDELKHRLESTNGTFSLAPNRVDESKKDDDDMQKMGTEQVLIAEKKMEDKTNQDGGVDGRREAIEKGNRTQRDGQVDNLGFSGGGLGYSREKKGKRWRMLARNRRVEQTKYSELKRSKQPETLNSDSIIKHKLVQNKDTDDMSANLKQAEGLRLRRNGQDSISMKEPKSENGVKDNEDVRVEKNVPGNQDDDVIVEPGLEVEDDRAEEDKEETNLAEF